MENRRWQGCIALAVGVVMLWHNLVLSVVLLTLGAYIVTAPPEEQEGDNG